jgi:tetratricopeptide (TPR) repeat protein
MVASGTDRNPSKPNVPRFATGMLPPIVAFACLAFGGLASGAGGAEIDEAEQLFRAGKYDECAAMAAEEISGGLWGESWGRLKVRAELARGKYDDAMATARLAVRRFPASVALRWLKRDVDRFQGLDDEAAAELETIETLVVNAPQRYGEPVSRTILGRFFLARGADARKVLDQFYDVAIKQQPDYVDAYFATAELALEKEDGELAASTLRKAPKAAAEDPQYHYLLARAFVDSDRGEAARAIAAALKINPRHVDSLLLRADQLIDAESYAEADGVLKQVVEVNPNEPRASAYQAVLAHLRNDRDAETAARNAALEHWKSNPEIDHLIGRKISQKYRFAEGSEYQKRALGIDAAYLPAKVQLCQDLLRLGDETEGWKLAAEIFAKDGYNVLAYNLVTLRDRIAGFRTLKADGFVVRMDAREADLYGPRVLALLGRARKALCEKYEVKIDEPVVVEIFPAKKEFAVRTFGLPGADGLLGVCFGHVITANSPASQGAHPSNWEAVLWHEFCHVVTLSKTRNKMPRWLSEGISVHEERRQDPTWGMAITPGIRAMLLGKELTPLSKLSSAFLAPKTAGHLQFAYFESSLAIDFLVERSGLPALKGVLDDLGAGISLNDSLPKRTKTSLEDLDRDFTKFARDRARSVAPDASWAELEKLPGKPDSAALEAWLEKDPKNFAGMQRLAVKLVAEEKWAKAKEVLKRLKALYPEYVGPENAYMLLATVYRKESNPVAERAVLEELAARDGDASDAYLRLMDLDEAARDWPALERNANRLLAVNPLIAAPHRGLALASEQLGRRAEAVAAYRSVTLLDDTDPAGVHYRFARLLSQAGKRDEARRECLKSLDEAPRFLDAHRLLLELTDHPKAEDARPPASPF